MTYQAWLGEMLMGEGATKEEAIEEAVREYEGQFAAGEAYNGYPGFDSKEDFVAALDVSTKDD